MTDLERAIEDLKAHYDRALKIPYVRNPLAWALYRVWRKYDSKGEKQNESARKN